MEKKMLRYLSAGLLVVAIVVGAQVGCGPRMAVAGKKVLDQIDKVLGKLNVQLEKVEQAHAELSEKTASMRKERFRAQANVAKLTDEKKDLDGKIDSYKADLVRLRDLMKDASAASGTVEVNGKEIAEGKLEILAQSTIKKMKAAERALIRNKTLSDAWSKSLSVLVSNADVSEKQLKKLDDQIDEIKAKKSALDAMKEASSITGSEASISDKFNDLTKDVDNLLTEVDIEMLDEAAKVEERMLNEESDVSLDDILGADASTDATLSEIDAILGGN